MHSHPWVRFYSALFISAIHHYTFGECRYILFVLQPCILMQISFLSLGIRQGCMKRREYLAQTHGQYIWCYLYDVTCVFCSFCLNIFVGNFRPANICFQKSTMILECITKMLTAPWIGKELFGISLNFLDLFASFDFIKGIKWVMITEQVMVGRSVIHDQAQKGNVIHAVTYYNIDSYNVYYFTCSITIHFDITLLFVQQRH